MSNAVIPKERQSAYQRWEMASFGDDQRSRSDMATQSAQMLSNEALAQIREQARQEGYAAGFAEGQAAGHASGLIEGQHEIAAEIARLNDIAQNFSAETARADELIAHDMLDLSLDLAKAMLKTALAVRPELVLPIVSEAIRYLPNVQQATLTLNPDDAQLVHKHMGDVLGKADWRVSEDPRLERGGCRIDTASNQIDASATSQWQRLANALGKESDWLAP
ncbi:flagellar assembly protein FliH [Undibacterium arcticum]|uniref:Flagellar assembly protein FliH n=1 Tax=Undibacterium arcticum TaxID=1762892 RepID=A0ABV7F5W3_9BURK